MALIDKDVVLNSNPTKRLRIAFENMRSNYTDASAKAYMETYKDQPLAFIIENSRYIFAEPIYGLNFYLESVISNDHAFMFTEYENEKEKIESYLEEHGKQMPDSQRKLYEDMLTVVTDKYNATSNTRTIISHACLDDETKNQYDNFVESVYAMQTNPEKISDVKEFMESTNSADLFYALTPYAVKLNSDELEYTLFSNINRFFKECTIDNRNINESEWKHYIESVIIVSKLYNDDIYKESVSSMRRQNSIIFEGLALESVKSQLDELFIEHVTENAGPNKFNANTFNCYYSTPSNAVNRIFDDDFMYDMMREENEKFKMERTKLYEIALNVLYEYVVHDYQTCDDLANGIVGYNYFNEGVSIEDAFTELSGSAYILTEADDSVEDVDDKDISDMESETTDSSDSTKDDETSKAKVSEPTDKNLANKIQNKALDREAKFLKKKAESERKGLESKNAVKAVTAIPKHIANSIKNFIASWDKMDDDRRKSYIIKPGFRKKAFRNLKVALTYGGAAIVDMSLVPVIFIARRLSKHKDIRIRNELARELDTEIKVCEEKITDATANGNMQERYKLIRIKSDLEKEALRVKSNSKYI